MDGTATVWSSRSKINDNGFGDMDRDGFQWLNRMVRAHRFQPEDNGVGDYDDGNEGVWSAILAGVDAVPVLTFGDQVFDYLAQLVEGYVVAILHFSVKFWREAGGRSSARSVRCGTSRCHSLYPRASANGQDSV